jgi:hypothetical protein
MAHCWGAITSVLLLLACSGSPAHADPFDDCNSTDAARMLSGCTAVLATAVAPMERLAALARRGYAQKQAGNCEAAIVDFSNALQLAPQTVAVLALRGECYAAINQPKLALADFDAALKLEPKNAEALAGRSRLLTAEQVRPATASTPTAPAKFDGIWIITEVCPAVSGALGYAKSVAVQVSGGVFHGELGVKGKPDSLSLDGKIAMDGNVSGNASGLTGDKSYSLGGANPGTPYTFSIQGQIAGISGTGKRTNSGRNCNFGFVKQESGGSVVTDLSGNWSLQDGRSLYIKQNGNQVSWTTCCRKGHESLVTSVSAMFDGKNLVGTFHFREGNAQGEGTLNYTLDGYRLEGGWKTSDGQVVNEPLTRQTESNLAGNWKTLSGRIITLNQTGTQVRWNPCCRTGHPDWSAEVLGVFDGKNLVGTFHWREGGAQGNGTVSYMFEGNKLEGFLKLSDGEAIMSMLTRQ